MAFREVCRDGAMGCGFGCGGELAGSLEEDVLGGFLLLRGAWEEEEGGVAGESLGGGHALADAEALCGGIGCGDWLAWLGGVDDCGGAGWLGGLPAEDSLEGEGREVEGEEHGRGSGRVGVVERSDAFLGSREGGSEFVAWGGECREPVVCVEVEAQSG
jgi:hypothetical protein